MSTIYSELYTVRKGGIAYVFEAKFETMRKADEWVIYPVSDIESVIIQCGTRIARLNLLTGEGILSARRSGGAYNVHLSPALGAKPYQFPKGLCEAILESPVAGTKVNLSNGHHHF